MHTKEQVKAVHEIHGLLEDSRREYVATAGRVRNTGTRELLLKMAGERMELEGELERDLAQHGSGAAPVGTAHGALHRVVQAFRDAVNDTSDVNVMVECEKQERVLVNHYIDVLNGADLNEATRAVLARQLREVEANVRKVREARNAQEGVEEWGTR